MDAAVDRYLTWLAAERRVSPHTLAGYGRDCAALAQFSTAPACAPRRGAGASRRVPRTEQRRGLSARSRAALAALRGLFAFLVREGVLAVDPSRELRRRASAGRCPRARKVSVVELLGAASSDPLVSATSR